MEDVEDAEASLGINASGEEFTAALSRSQYNTSLFTANNVNLLATKLIRYDEYTKDQRIQVYSGRQQSWTVMNYVHGVANKGIDFNEAAAVEYLGTQAKNEDQWSSYGQIYKDLASIQPGWLSTWFDWRIAVRCDK